jgi:hypothetical protein
MGDLHALVSAHRGAFFALSVGSTVLTLGLVALAPWVMLRLPPDHFVRPRSDVGALRHAARVGAGVALLLLGAAMLVLPGQGVLTMIVGVSLLGLPVERAIARFMLRRPGVARALNRIRTRAGKPPFVFGSSEEVAPPASPASRVSSSRR